MLFALFWFGMAVFIWQMTAGGRAARDQMDEDFEKHFQGDFFRAERERRQRERQQSSAFDVVPLVGIGATSLVGTGLLLSPFWVWISRRRRWARTCFALTSQCALVWGPGVGGTHLHRYGPQQLAGCRRVERGGGTGDLVFEEKPVTFQVTVQDPGGGSHQELRHGLQQHGFLNIAAVREVEQLLRQCLSSKAQGPGGP
jgi:hypothetical protein